MIVDYLFGFADEAAAQTALGAEFAVVVGADWAWDSSRVMATTRGAGAALVIAMGVDPLPLYAVSVSTAGRRSDLWAIAACLREGDRDSATVLQTRFDSEQEAALAVSPIFSGMEYIFQGVGVAFVLDSALHPVGDSGVADLQATLSGG